MNIYHLCDRTVQDEYNQAGWDYTPAYFSAVFAYMGIPSTEISSDSLDKVGEDDILFVGANHPNRLPSCHLFILGSEVAKRVDKCYGFVVYKEQKLPIFAPFTKPTMQGDVCYFAQDETGNKIPAIVKKGKTIEFCFDLLGSIWFSGDGYFRGPSPEFPIPLGRTPDTRPIGNGYEIPYNDLLLSIIEDEMDLLKVPAIYKLPPMADGSVPDFALHLSGDDDCHSAQYNLNATLACEQYGFPYHINAMAVGGTEFAFTKEDFDEVISHGGEFGLHGDYTNGAYTFDSVKGQVEKFIARFGVHPLTNTNHCFIQHGTTAQRLRWFSKCGMIADNGKLGYYDPKDINAFDLHDYGFGTAFPRFSLDDAKHKNQPLLTMEIPINYYEPRLYEEDSSTKKIQEYITCCAKNGRFAQLFIHPHYLNDEIPHEKQAVCRVLEVVGGVINQNQYRVLYTTTNEIARFWKARQQATLKVAGNEIHCHCAVASLVALPFTVEKVKLNNQEAKIHCRDGKTLVFVPHGNHTISFDEKIQHQ